MPALLLYFTYIQIHIHISQISNWYIPDSARSPIMTVFASVSLEAFL